jgi:hypothetical protein
MRTQLLCTFAHRHDINLVLDYVRHNYDIPERRIFVFANDQNRNELYCTYNVSQTHTRGQNTISIHRKKETNTLYSINALNEVIRRMNNGVLDTTFMIPWERFYNSFILTDDAQGYRTIKLQMHQRLFW